MKAKRESKDTVVTVRTSKRVRTLFHASCVMRGASMSREINDFMARSITESGLTRAHSGVAVPRPVEQS